MNLILRKIWESVKCSQLVFQLSTSSSLSRLTIVFSWFFLVNNWLLLVDVFDDARKIWKAAREKSNCEIGYDHKRKTERLIINNRIVVVLLFSFCIAVLFPVWLVLSCGGWFMGDLKTTFFQSRRAQARKKARTSGRAAQATRFINPLKWYVYIVLVYPGF